MKILKCIKQFYLQTKKQLKLWNKYGRPKSDCDTKFYKD